MHTISVHLQSTSKQLSGPHFGEAICSSYKIYVYNKILFGILEATVKVWKSSIETCLMAQESDDEFGDLTIYMIACNYLDKHFHP